MVNYFSYWIFRWSYWIWVCPISKPIYISKYSFILNENDGSASLNLSSLAGLAGIAGLAGGSNNVNEDKLLYLANSRQIIGNTLVEKATINGEERTIKEDCALRLRRRHF
jgi:hypothetical protein